MSILGRGGKENEQDDELAAYPASSVGPGNDKSASEGRVGKTIVIRGELTGEEDLTIEGRVEGKINLPKHQLLVGQDGNVSAEVLAKTVTITGRMRSPLFIPRLSMKPWSTSPMGAVIFVRSRCGRAIAATDSSSSTSRPSSTAPALSTVS